MATKPRKCRKKICPDLTFIRKIDKLICTFLHHPALAIVSSRSNGPVNTSCRTVATANFGEWLIHSFIFIFLVYMVSRETIRKKVMELAREATEIAGVELFDVELLGQRGKMIVRVTIDNEQGIGIKDCERVSRQLEALLNVEDPIQGSYTLEVTTPGLDRPLRSIEDFERFRGRLARVVTTERIDNQTFFVGRIKSVKGDSIVLELENKEVEIPYKIVSKARLEIEF
ncbi:MAG TPA: ribosome maturation factor RimP [Nitrospirae bacterium]|nr:ribosome maturation factor RimP [Nitrospirota bacterium]